MIWAFLVWLGIIGCFYAYLGYPLTLWALLRYKGERKLVRASFGQPLPRLTVIIAARNEEACIAKKIEQTLALRYGTRSAEEAGVQIIVASDCSDDGTDEIVRGFAGRGVELVRPPERGGKERAQRHAVMQARGALLLFTDAKIRLNEDALTNLARYFEDPTIGAVSSVDVVEESAEGASGEGFYVRYEMWLRSLESRFDSLVGLSGSCFGVTRVVADALRDDVPSDFALLLEARRRGLRGVQGDDVIGYYKSVTSEKAEFDRKVRTVLRGMATLSVCRKVLDPSVYGSFAWQVASHKLGRWLVPWWLLGIAIGLSVLAPRSLFYGMLWLVMIGFLWLALEAYRKPELQQRTLYKIPLFFLVVNAGIAVAWWRFLSGKRTVAWDPSVKGR